jgi:hypothetical protein
VKIAISDNVGGVKKESIGRIIVAWLGSRSSSRPLSGYRLAIMHRVPEILTHSVGCDRALRSCVLPLLVSRVAHRWV